MTQEQNLGREHPVVERLRDDFQAHFGELHSLVGSALVQAALQGTQEAQEDVLAMAKHLGKLQQETTALLTVLRNHLHEQVVPQEQKLTEDQPVGFGWTE